MTDRTEAGLEALRNREVTLRKAADIAGVSSMEMLSLAADEAIDCGYTLEDLECDLERF